jgi:hypothetical protein
VLLGKSTPKNNILGEFQRNLLSLLYCMVMDVFFGDFIFTWTFQSENGYYI